MTEDPYQRLSARERIELPDSVARKRGLAPSILEKNSRVCVMPGVLFSLPNLRKQPALAAEPAAPAPPPPTYVPAPSPRAKCRLPFLPSAAEINQWPAALREADLDSDSLSGNLPTSQPESAPESQLAAKFLVLLKNRELGKTALAQALGHKTVSGELNKQIKQGKRLSL